MSTLTVTAGTETVELTSSFAQRYSLTSALLAKAIEDPTQHNFDRASSQAILTIGAYATVISVPRDELSNRVSLQWEIGQDLARHVRDVAREYGFTI